MATKGNQNATADRLSPGRILAQTDNSVIPAGSQDILLTGNAKEIMQDMRLFAEGLKGVEGLVNRSNTGNMLGAQASLVAGFTADPITAISTAIGTVAVPYAVSRGMSSQWLKNWMRNAPKEGGKKALAQWKKDGARLAAAQSATPFFQAILDMSNSNNTDSGALEE